MKHIAVIGAKKSGKTAVVSYLIERLSRDGFKVAAVKHIHHEVTIDTEGKDTYRMSQSGAQIVASVSPKETAVLFYGRHSSAIQMLWEIFDREKIDVVLYEGFRDQLGKNKDISKIVTVKHVSELDILNHLEGPILAIFSFEKNVGNDSVQVFGPDAKEDFYIHVLNQIGLKR
ncbi:MAG: molybdopterin-guanine dinucleotide biosynthesis protein B [Candidatus Caldarchaeum sp.]